MDTRVDRGPDIAAGRLQAEDYIDNFADLHPPLTRSEAHIEADRCYFCFDAPCMQACPTHIDIPIFIRQIQADNPGGAGKTILEANIMGGMCARVCPVETLCGHADGLLAGRFAERTWYPRPKALLALPLLGIPGVCADNEHAGYYDDTLQFRPPPGP